MSPKMEELSLRKTFLVSCFVLTTESVQVLCCCHVIIQPHPPDTLSPMAWVVIYNSIILPFDILYLPNSLIAEVETAPAQQESSSMCLVCWGGGGGGGGGWGGGINCPIFPRKSMIPLGSRLTKGVSTRSGVKRFEPVFTGRLVVLYMYYTQSDFHSTCYCIFRSS